MRRYVISKKVGKQIKRIRRQRGYTQEDIADKSGMHVSTLGRIERGEINPPLQTLNKIAQALKVKTKEILP